MTVLSAKTNRRGVGRRGATRVKLATIAVAGVLAVGLEQVARAEPAPRRIVSINLCSDQILLDLVPLERIAALSHLASDPDVSAVAERARGLPSTRGEAETVLAFDPDLVLAGTFSTPATLALLERVGQRVVKVPLASDLDGVRSAIRQVAAAVGEGAKAEAMLADLDRQLAAAQAGQGHGKRHTALVYQVNGLASGPGSLADALLAAAGLANHATTLGLGAGGALALETLVSRPPDLLVLSGPSDEYRTAVADNLRHPALAALIAERAAVVLPWRLWLCGTQHVGQAVVRLGDARRALEAKARP